MTGSITWWAWGLAAAFFSLVALPLASSSPYPTPSRQDWFTQDAPAQMTLASASSFSLASASSTPAQVGQTVSLVNTVRTLSIRRPIGDEPEPEAERPLVTASIGNVRSREAAYEQRLYEHRLAAAPSSHDDEPATASAPAGEISAPASRPRANPAADEINTYLWEVYQRQPAKKDRGGDFTWKDPAAANRMGKTLQAYVIAGMDADFRELVYHAGKALDKAGVEWTIVSGFRDDWRQSIASGIKARTGYSRHGGSVAVGGYGHGRAIDIGHIDSQRSGEVWRWIDANGAKFGLHRPYRFDPPHVEPRLEWRRLASNLRRERTGATAVAAVESDDQAEETRPAAQRKARNVRVAHARTGRPARSNRRAN
jgi:hypothetical protein